MPKNISTLPLELQWEISDMLPHRWAAFSGLPMSPKKHRAVAHARVWESIFKPSVAEDYEQVCQLISKNNELKAGELLLIGSDLQYLYFPKKQKCRDKLGRSLHLLLMLVVGKDAATTLSVRKEDLERMNIFRKYTLLPYKAILTGIHLMELDITLHFEDIGMPELLRLGVHRSMALRYQGSKKLDKAKITYRLEADPATPYIDSFITYYSCHVEVPSLRVRRPGGGPDLQGPESEKEASLIKAMHDTFLNTKKNKIMIKKYDKIEMQAGTESQA